MSGYVDISGCSEVLKKKYKPITRIPVTVGKHYCDLDIVMGNLTDDEKKKSDVIASTPGPYDKNLPIGINLRKLPVGAVLHLEIDD